MRRVLIADDPRLSPRLLRLRAVSVDGCDVLIAPPDQLSFWRTSGLLRADGLTGGPADLDSLVARGEGVDLVVAASSADCLAVASKLGFRRGSTVTVLPDARQTADWVFSLYPLSEGGTPRVHGLLDHRTARAVAQFRGTLPGEPRDRHLQCACTLPAVALTPGEIERLFVEDIDLMRGLAGEFKNLIAVAVPDGGGGYRSLTVTLGGENSGTVTWTVQPGSAFSWQLRQGSGTGPILGRGEKGDYSMTPAAGDAAPASNEPLAVWQDVLRAFDDLAALRRSLKKRRSVELQTEIISEQAQFKSVMSASGCGLLMATLFGAVALLAAGAAFDPRPALQRTSEKAGLVLRDGDFRPGTPEMTEDATAEWPAKVRRLAQTAAPILIEQTGEEAVDRQRRDRLVSLLGQAGVPGAESRVEVTVFRGGLFLGLLTACWIVLFLPLGIFLAVQSLLLVAPRVGPGERAARDAA